MIVKGEVSPLDEFVHIGYYVSMYSSIDMDDFSRLEVTISSGIFRRGHDEAATAIKTLRISSIVQN